MSGKAAKLARKEAAEVRKEIQKAIKVDYDRFMREVRELEFWDRVNVSMALIIKTDSVYKGQTVLWIFLMLLFALGGIFGWICNMRLNG